MLKHGMSVSSQGRAANVKFPARSMCLVNEKNHCRQYSRLNQPSSGVSMMVENAHLDCLTQHTTVNIHSCSTPAGRNLSWAEDSSRLRATWPALESLCELGLLTHSQLPQAPLGGGTSSFCLTHLTTACPACIPSSTLWGSASSTEPG